MFFKVVKNDELQFFFAKILLMGMLSVISIFLAKSGPMLTKSIKFS